VSGERITEAAWSSVLSESIRALNACGSSVCNPKYKDNPDHIKTGALLILKDNAGTQSLSDYLKEHTDDPQAFSTLIDSLKTSWLSILPSLLLSKSFKASKPLAALLPLDKIVLLPNSSEPSSILPLLFLSKTSKPSSLPTQPLCSAKLLLSWSKYTPISLSNQINDGSIQFAKDGDTLSQIAQDNGLSLNELLALNPQYKANPDDVKAGALLILKDNTRYLLIIACG
jgi:hypothetical protein